MLILKRLRQVCIVGDAEIAADLVRAVKQRGLDSVSVVVSDDGDIQRISSQLPTATISFYPREMIQHILPVAKIVFTAVEGATEPVITEELVKRSIFGPQKVSSVRRL